ncbi:origin recognition complex subunit 3 [Trichoderma gamsii]|uniref:Origin recognition complex subunit 3 n=1 Tax=Trichoderma gamsii TaxID=398673 RepID=A0A2P4ZBK4_9HYPO|nr:origin recognition complex subunit 3 [Trichoderma gamsii]PON21656.1 origin recognition complex subunit 3 [Trichoderma gamsii]
MSTEDPQNTFTQEDHQVAFIFNPEENEAPRRERPPKRRKTAKRASATENEAGQDEENSPLWFTPLLSGAEGMACVRRRERLLEEKWAVIDARIKDILRDSNSATLDDVSRFVTEAKAQCGDKIPSAFIITGPNIASQDLLFEQLSDSLQKSSPSKFIRLRSSEATNLKNALKKIIQDATSKTLVVDGEEDLQLRQGSNRRYLPYDLEALHEFLGHQPHENIFVAFQDSEGFDSGLLSDIIALLSSWRPQIPFTLLFGIATSIDLLESRLLKSACRLIYGAQFDCVQTDTILENVFKGTVISSDVPLRLGPQILRSMLDRQRDHMAGIQAFISSLKYIYMCHFYANALSVLLAPDIEGGEEILQAEHIEALRYLPSFRNEVEKAVGLATVDSLQHARSLIEDDEYLLSQARASNDCRQGWMDGHLRSLLVREAAGAIQPPLSRAYVDSLSATYPDSGNGSLTEYIRRMGISALIGLLRRAIYIFKEGEPSLHLQPASREEDVALLSFLGETLSRLEQLESDAESAGITLLTKYSSQSKVMRTTVIAQRVQLSRDSAALRDEDRQLTDIVDAVTERLTAHIRASRPDKVLFSETWLYDSRSPLRDVMVPRPRVTFKRSLARPYDYLACSCCKGGDAEDGTMQATLPATSILYHLYLEAGSLINVADLWSAFYALVSGHKEEEKKEEESEDDDDDDDDEKQQKKQHDERKALVMFYRGLAELRAMGFVKSSKKKTDHIAKVRWL